MDGQLQLFAVNTAARSTGTPAATVSSGLNTGVVEWVIFIEMIMGFISQMIEQCQQNQQEVAASAHDPTRMQKVWFRAYVAANWRERGRWGWRIVARDTADAAMAEAASLDETTLANIVEEVRCTAVGKR